jgi:hypothetical protein
VLTSKALDLKLIIVARTGWGWPTATGCSAQATTPKISCRRPIRRA